MDNVIHDRILIVDDDDDICQLVSDYLSSNGFTVKSVTDGIKLRQIIDEGQKFDLIIMDLMLPGETGLSLCRYLKKSKAADVPILILSARGDDVDRIIGLESGVDDYLTKPFVPRELTARIKAILRRHRTIPESVKSLNKVRILKFGTWRLDKIERCLIDEWGVASPLSTADYKLLVYLIENSGRVLLRDQLIDKIIGVESTPFDRAIDLRISRLRKRLKDNAKDSQYIRTIRNEGYLFVKKVTAE
jgi:two-component system OmpR family response regulator